ncbi:hypothetical protein BDM02DRAFT_1850424 [Thelephora ganbajun]|uniref:Uncharacterized protein n=1 Tax=Thelephora ganbajun TaxID=370292 RepID=A0ACB6ZJ08_THEGA|nr:hypothetical protein BDM02DRAFT_1850424 [Thelephora ganbajun]
MGPSGCTSWLVDLGFGGESCRKCTDSGEYSPTEGLEKEVRHISGVDLYRLVWLVTEREEMGLSRVRSFTFTQLDDTMYESPCIVGKHWVGGMGFYAFWKRNFRRRLWKIRAWTRTISNVPFDHPSLEVTSLGLSKGWTWSMTPC